MQWYITSFGIKQTVMDFEGIIWAAQEVRPAFEEIYLTILDIEEEIFAKQGARGLQPKWEPVTLKWSQEKVRKNLDYHILRAYGKLRESLVTYRHPMQNIRIEKTKIVFGTKYEQGKWLFHGWRQPTKTGVTEVPARPFVHFTRQDADAFGREIMRHLLRQRPGARISVTAL